MFVLNQLMGNSFVLSSSWNKGPYANLRTNLWKIRGPVPAIPRYTAPSISASRLLHERSPLWSTWHPTCLVAAYLTAYSARDPPSGAYGIQQAWWPPSSPPTLQEIPPLEHVAPSQPYSRLTLCRMTPSGMRDLQQVLWPHILHWTTPLKYTTLNSHPKPPTQRSLDPDVAITTNKMRTSTHRDPHDRQLSTANPWRTP